MLSFVSYGRIWEEFFALRGVFNVFGERKPIWRKGKHLKKSLTIKDLPDSEKPYEKFLKYGAEKLSDAELLAVIIKAGARGIKATEVAQNFLNVRERNLLNLYAMPYDEMKNLTGIGKVKAIQLKCIAELSERMAETRYRREIKLNDPASAARYYMERLRHKDQEHVIIALFNAKCCLIADKELAVGSATAACVTPREIFAYALSHYAVNIILLHNHPSGSPTPSKEDDALTALVCECGHMLQITLSDHIIIGDHKYYSYREQEKIF